MDVNYLMGGRDFEVLGRMKKMVFFSPPPYRWKLVILFVCVHVPIPTEFGEV